MNTVEIIRKKRNGEQLSNEEFHFIIDGFIKNKIPDYQMSAFLMAVYFRGMTKEETATLTKVMLHSGKVIDLSAIKGSKIDKHSTGGVGDKTSMILAPIVAAAGVKVPMISGRGLGHTGGTLDKLESIPGFKTDINLRGYKSILSKCGAVMIGQTKEIAPADKLIYALRDVTATVESIPLITASIMSKKLAEGAEGFVIDVKTGNGAFMQKYEDSVSLAKSLIETAKAFNKKAIAYITDMNQPLGHYIGNWFEIYETVRVLQGEWIDDLCRLSYTLSGAMLYLGKKAGSVEEGYAISEQIVKSGKAFDKFIEIVKLQGGDISVIYHPEKYPKSKYHKKIYSEKSGYLTEVDTYEIGIASLELGAGRLMKEDKIDPKAGIVFHPKIGAKLREGDLIAEIYTDMHQRIESSASRILNAVKIAPKKGVKKEIIRESFD